MYEYHRFNIHYTNTVQLLADMHLPIFELCHKVRLRDPHGTIYEDYITKAFTATGPSVLLFFYSYHTETNKGELIITTTGTQCFGVFVYCGSGLPDRKTRSLYGPRPKWSKFKALDRHPTKCPPRAPRWNYDLRPVHWNLKSLYSAHLYLDKIDIENNGSMILNLFQVHSCLTVQYFKRYYKISSIRKLHCLSGSTCEGRN